MSTATYDDGGGGGGGGGGSTDTDHAIPVIDLSLISDDEGDAAAVAKRIVQAFFTVGFATLVNHGVEPSTVEKAFAASKSFFDLPAEAKRQYEYQSHTSNRGYIAMGSESHDAVQLKSDQKETFDIGKEGEVGFETPWPNELLGFKDDILRYFEEFDRLNLRLMKLLAMGLQLDDDNFFVDRCNQQHCNLRLLHYPELKRESLSFSSTAHEDAGVTRGATHTDFGSITLLAQDMIGGLRVQRLDGSWTEVTPVKGSIIVNVGDMMQRWTNDALRASPHQVVDLSHDSDIIPERYSIAFFCNANKDVTIDPSELSLVGAVGESGKYPPINALEYLTKRLSDTIAK